MRLFFSDTGLGLVVTFLGLALTAYMAGREAWERRQVVFHGGPSIKYTPTTATVSVSCTNTGNRATVVRNIRLILDDGRTLPTVTDPPLPVRLDAPDERVVRLLDISRADGSRIRRAEVDLLEHDKPSEVTNWPVIVELAAATAKGTAAPIGILTVTPPKDAAGEHGVK